MRKPALNDLLHNPFDHFDRIKSTNLFLLNLPPERTTEGYTCSASTQTNGIGRQHNHWISPIGGMYLSMLFKPLSNPETWGFLSLLAGVAAAEAIENTTKGLTVQLKWPNDLLLNGKKVGGILLQSSVGSISRVVVGIGINVFTDLSELPSRQHFPVTTIKTETQHVPKVSQLAQISRRMTFEKYIDWINNPSCISESWLNRSATLNKSVVVQTPNKKYIGIDRGIDEMGYLQIEINGCIQTFHSINSLYIEETKS